ncbi:hypothetical protein [Streptomyces sp. NPDC050287]|uniref:hypothetical protein n=1 Tax=Streptomyces sp. NPDC050287 TaxID=3365608 RepID=UPI0037A2AC5A
MSRRTALATLGTALALGTGLALLPTQAQAATVVDHHRRDDELTTDRPAQGA